MEEESDSGSDCSESKQTPYDWNNKYRVLYPSKRLFFLKYRSMAVMSNLMYDLLCGKFNFDDLDCFFEVYSTDIKSNYTFDYVARFDEIFKLLNGMNPGTKHPLCCSEKKNLIDYMISHGDMCKGDIIEYKSEYLDNGTGTFEHQYFMRTDHSFKEI